MYGFINPHDRDFKEANGEFKNEISIQNLIAIATNDRLFQSLDDNTKERLTSFVNLYTEKSLDAIDRYKVAYQKRKEIFSKFNTKY